ncbi:chorismate mutase [Candidatus Peregrinibacteria bacterium]|nr:chorismate mutase [Candidatus Peregrinibacteria bacterium]
MSNNKKLNNIRKKLDQIDDKIIKTLRIRSKLIKQIGEIKKKLKLPIRNPQREKLILKKLKNKYEKRIFSKILLESRKLQAHYVVSRISSAPPERKGM